jgi:hypothetical protein
LIMGGGAKQPSYQPTQIEDEEKKVKKIRTAMFETKGGILGEELKPEEVEKRNRMFGN